MAKGDMMEKLRMGLQPGLAPIPGNAAGKPNPMQNTLGPSPGMMQEKLGVMPNRETGNMIPNPAGMQPMAPMTTGSNLAFGQHPIGAPNQKRLRYNGM